MTPVDKKQLRAEVRARRSRRSPEEQAAFARELAAWEPPRGVRRVALFLGVGDEPAIHEFFERHMTPENAHVGRWREGRHAPGRAWIQRRYERTVGALERERNHAAPSLRAALEREAR